MAGLPEGSRPRGFLVRSRLVGCLQRLNALKRTAKDERFAAEIARLGRYPSSHKFSKRRLSHYEEITPIVDSKGRMSSLLGEVAGVHPDRDARCVLQQ
eukprot:2834612-Amphidinium_carterae.1